MKGFQTLDEIKMADVDRLASVEGMNRRAAEQVFAFFHIANDE